MWQATCLNLDSMGFNVVSWDGRSFHALEKVERQKDEVSEAGGPPKLHQLFSRFYPDPTGSRSLPSDRNRPALSIFPPATSKKLEVY